MSTIARNERGGGSNPLIGWKLDPSTIGSVALENHPPGGLDRGDWNGIAIVILDPSRHR